MNFFTDPVHNQNEVNSMGNNTSEMKSNRWDVETSSLEISSSLDREHFFSQFNLWSSGTSLNELESRDDSSAADATTT